MVKSYFSGLELLPKDSSSSSESSSELIPRSISFLSWTHLPHPRANLLDAAARKWMTDVQPAIRPFVLPPPSGDDFFKDTLVTPHVRREDALLFHDVPNAPNYSVGPSLLRSRLICGEFPWTSCAFVARATCTSGWSEWVDYVFVNDGPFVERWSSTTHTFFTAWGEFAPSLEDVCVLLKLPLFGDYDITSSPIDSHILDKARELKTATIESAKYSREFLTRMRSEPSFVGGSFVKKPPRKVKGTGNVLPPAQRKVARESLKYTYATWISFYGRLDQVQDQLLSSFGRFPINTFVDLIFLQCFLFERYPEYAPVRAVPEPPSEGDERPLEPHVWGWASGRPRHSLLDIIDEEDQFVHRPYTKNFFPGVEGLHRLYQESEFIPPERSGRVLDVWVAYYARLKTAIKRYEQRDSMQHFQNIPIMCKDPYYITSSLKAKPRQEIGSDRGKKRKPPKPAKEPATALPSSEEGEGGPKKKAKAPKAFHSNPPVTVAARKSAPRSSRAKMMPLLPVRASVRLREKPSNKSSNPSSSSSPIEIVYNHGSPTPGTPVSHPGDDQTIQDSPSPSVSHTITRGSFTEEASLEGDDSHSASTRGSGPVGDRDVTPPVQKGVADDGLVAEGTIAAEQQNSLQVAKVVLELDDASSPLLEDPVVAPPPEPSEINVSNPIGGASILASLLPEEDAHMLVDFASSHEGFLLSEKDFPLAFLKPAYAVFADFLHFVRTHYVADLLGVHKGKVAGDLKALALFGFKGGWFERIVEQLSQSVPLDAFEDMEKLADAIVQQSQRSNELKTQLEPLEAKLAQSESELERLSLRRKEIEDARAILNSSLDL
ncbi:Aminotransferase-like, plant mobile domain [Sesbania bispinosa]|nr:Aminotransferase-like, plant mobile domain [Sesbania bispinosa]